MIDRRHDEPAEELDNAEQTISLREIGSTLGRYKTSILVTIGSVAFAWVLGAIVLLLLSPSERQAELPFRLEFKGAERGEYPNGAKFEPTEILSGPVLLTVYQQNQLERYLPFNEFRTVVFVLQSNEALEQLIRKYRARLSDPKLAAVDRERLEAEFAEKRASIAKSDHSLVFSVPETSPLMPRKIQAKILSDLLQEWARQTIQNKGVVLYDLSILSSGIFEAEALEESDYVIALDMLRSRIQRVIANIDQLLAIPGAKVVRPGAPDAASLAELRVRLEDTLQFRVQPLLGLVLNEGISRDPASSIRFLETRLRFNEIERQQAQRRATAVRESLLAYVQQSGRHDESTAMPSNLAGSQGNATIIPQLSDTFLQQVMEMASSEKDLLYRQALVDQLRDESLRVVPLESEAQYYQQLLESLRGFEASTRRPAAAELESIGAQIAEVTSTAIGITNQVNEIYREVSQNLNPSTVLYSTTQPTFFIIERSLAIPRVLLTGVLLLFFATFAAVSGALLHDRMFARRGQEAPSEPSRKREPVARKAGVGEQPEPTSASPSKA